MPLLIANVKVLISEPPTPGKHYFTWIQIPWKKFLDLWFDNPDKNFVRICVMLKYKYTTLQRKTTKVC